MIRTSIAAIALTATLGVAGAQAQPRSNPKLPPSPYALPEPTSRGPDVDDLIEGNGKLHYSGQWRHWGDSRNGGELFSSLFAPNGVAGGGPADRRDDGR